MNGEILLDTLGQAVSTNEANQMKDIGIKEQKRYESQKQNNHIIQLGQILTDLSKFTQKLF